MSMLFAAIDLTMLMILHTYHTIALNQLEQARSIILKSSKEDLDKQSQGPYIVGEKDGDDEIDCDLDNYD